MFTQMKDHLAKQLAEIKANGLYKVERTIITPQEFLPYELPNVAEKC